MLPALNSFELDASGICSDAQLVKVSANVYEAFSAEQKNFKAVGDEDVWGVQKFMQNLFG